MKKQSDMLQAYLDTGYTPEQVRDMAFLYREKCQEVARLRSEMRELKERDADIHTNDGWIPVGKFGNIILFRIRTTRSKKESRHLNSGKV